MVFGGLLKDLVFPCFKSKHGEAGRELGAQCAIRLPAGDEVAALCGAVDDPEAFQCRDSVFSQSGFLDSYFRFSATLVEAEGAKEPRTK